MIHLIYFPPLQYVIIWHHLLSLFVVKHELRQINNPHIRSSNPLNLTTPHGVRKESKQESACATHLNRLRWAALTSQKNTQGIFWKQANYSLTKGGIFYSLFFHSFIAPRCSFLWGRILKWNKDRTYRFRNISQLNRPHGL